MAFRVRGQPRKAQCRAPFREFPDPEQFSRYESTSRAHSSEGAERRIGAGRFGADRQGTSTVRGYDAAPRS